MLPFPTPPQGFMIPKIMNPGIMAFGQPDSGGWCWETGSESNRIVVHSLITGALFSS
jgi:hypothetical protein